MVTPAAIYAPCPICPIIVVVFGCLKTVAKFEYSVPKIESGACGYPV
jgi:hypothetical protein